MSEQVRKPAPIPPNEFIRTGYSYIWQTMRNVLTIIVPAVVLAATAKVYLMVGR